MNLLSFGEVLWDVYPDKKVIGGAPFNFAGIFAALGGEAAIVSAVGKDDLAADTLAAVERLKVNTAYIEKTDYPTGVCEVTIDGKGIPSYFLKEGMAYDNIPAPFKIAEKYFDAVYFGTLAQRRKNSAESLEWMLKNIRYKEVLFDINIRQTFYNKKVLEDGLRACTVLKFSREEAFVFTETGIIEPERCMDSHSFLQLLCRYLSRFYQIPVVAVTLDKDGAFVYSQKDDCFLYSQKPQGRVVSTVGGGDSFCAAFLFTLLQGKPLQSCLNNAVTVSDYVVGQWESVPDLPASLLFALE